MIYRKRGAVVRWENGSRITVTEGGVAIEEDDCFRCYPNARDDSFQPPFLALAEEHPDVPFATERLILTEGYAEHECGVRRWSEHTRRLHASLTHGALRALVDQASFDMAAIGRIGAALERAETTEREIPARVCVSPNVTAALLPHLAGAPVGNARIVQTAGGVDGYGADVVEADSAWPNVWRPSYRVRPVRMPLNLRIECDVREIDPDLPRAIALLAPVEGRVASVLVVEGRRVYPSRLRVTRVEAASGTGIWYPYGGGSFGAEMVL